MELVIDILVLSQLSTAKMGSFYNLRTFHSEHQEEYALLAPTYGGHL